MATLCGVYAANTSHYCESGGYINIIVIVTQKEGLLSSRLRICKAPSQVARNNIKETVLQHTTHDGIKCHVCIPMQDSKELHLESLITHVQPNCFPTQGFQSFLAVDDYLGPKDGSRYWRLFAHFFIQLLG